MKRIGTTGDGAYFSSVGIGLWKRNSIQSASLLQGITPTWDSAKKLFSLEKEVKWKLGKNCLRARRSYISEFSDFPFKSAKDSSQIGRWKRISSHLPEWEFIIAPGPAESAKYQAGISLAEIPWLASDSDPELRYRFGWKRTMPNLLRSDSKWSKAKTLKALSLTEYTRRRWGVGKWIWILDHAKAKLGSCDEFRCWKSLFDENPATFGQRRTMNWHSFRRKCTSSWRLTYFPMGKPDISSGFIQNYEFQNFADGKIWKTVSKENSPWLPIIPHSPGKFDLIGRSSIYSSESDQNYGWGIPLLFAETRVSDTLNSLKQLLILFLPIC